MANREIKIKEIRRNNPDVRLYVLALIELTRQLQAEEENRVDSDQDSVQRARGGHA